MLTVVEQRPGYVAVRAAGRDARRVFEAEVGGHRWQRIPPSEKRGRVHTSTVTVAVLPDEAHARVELDLSEVDVRTTGASRIGRATRPEERHCRGS